MTVDRLVPAVRRQLVAEIAAAGGREVFFVASVDAGGTITEARVSARGTPDQVLALPGVARRGDMVLHNHPGGDLDPSGADLSVAARLHDGGVGFGIVNNAVTALYIVVEVPRTVPESPLDPFAIIGMLGAEGPVARRLGQYEDRQSQRDMAAHVTDAYNDGGVVLLEAGTGVGKSFAYLTPALAWSRANRERTVVSTNTINLQEQLVGKDLPLLKEALGEAEWSPSFALLKGWRNYLCRARLDQAVAAQRTLLEPDKVDEVLALREWAARTEDGTLADLPVPPSSEVWDEVAAESDLCPRLRCTHFDRCFLFRARRRAAEADVVVVNHHLLAADLAVRALQDNWLEAAVLPPYQRLVLDEAHHLEDVAATHLGSRVTSTGVARLLARCERNGRGLLPALMQELALSDDLLGRASLDLLRDRVAPALGEARRWGEAAFGRLHALWTAAEMVGPWRVDEDFARAPVWQDGLAAEVDGLLGALTILRTDVEEVGERLAQGKMSDRRLALLGEVRGVVRRLEAAGQGITRTLRPAAGEEPTVRWFERQGSRGTGVGLHAIPLDLAPMLRTMLFDRVRTVTLTSATLAAGGSFDFLESRLGLAGTPSPVTVREVLPSPFDYPSQCLLGIPEDMPDPREQQDAHDAAIVQVVSDLAHASDGGLFVLFTSHQALRRAARNLRGVLPVRWPLLVQGEAGRDHLLRRFREAGNAVLLGTDSFWEGVDVPGRALRGLVLTKLPFKVPSEPVTAARLERLAEQGEDGFYGYLLPLAGLKLKQGFGRLIRSRRDAGVVLLLDARVLTKRYGPSLLDGLPPAARITGRWRDIRTACEDFFARHGINAPAAS